MRPRHRGERRALPRVNRTIDGNGHQSCAEDWLRSRRGDCERERENGTHRSRDCPGKKSVAGKRTRARARPAQDDRAGRARRGVTEYGAMEWMESWRIGHLESADMSALLKRRHVAALRNAAKLDLWLLNSMGRSFPVERTLQSNVQAIPMSRLSPSIGTRSGCL